MKKFIPLILLTVAISLTSFSQTINYQSWAGDTACNIFGSPRPVNGYSHLTNIGQPKYLNGSIALECMAPSKGTQYQVNYDFKRGFRYVITVKASNIGGDSTNPALLRVQLSRSNAGNNAGCNGPQMIDVLSSDSIVVNNSWRDYVFTIPELYDSFPIFQVAAIPQSGAAFQTIYIRTIQIDEIAVNPDLVLSPTSFTITCGSVKTQTFTLTNPYNVTGITSYQWYLDDNNGWLYNGSPAPWQIITTTPTITLTEDSCRTTRLSNLTAWPIKDSTSYRWSYVAKPIIADNPPGNLSIVGPDSICLGSGTYSIANMPCGGQVVVWRISYYSAATLGCTSCLQTTLQYQNDSSFSLHSSIILTAMVWLPCYTYPIVLYKFVYAGPSPLQGLEYNTNEGEWSAPNMRMLGNTMLVRFGAYQNNFSNLSCSISSDSDPSFSFAYESAGYYRATFNSPTTTNPTGTVLLTTTHPQCGTNTIRLTFYKSPDPVNLQVAVTPVPAANTLNIALTEQSSSQKIIPQKNKAKNFSRVQVLDKMGNLKIDRHLTTQTNSISLDVSGLPNDIYVLKVFDGKHWWSKQISILH